MDQPTKEEICQSLREALARLSEAEGMHDEKASRNWRLIVSSLTTDLDRIHARENGEA